MSIRKSYIPYIHTYVHAKRCEHGERASSVQQGRTCEIGETEGKARHDLGGVYSQVGRERRRISEKCLPKADTSDRQRCDAI